MLRSGCFSGFPGSLRCGRISIKRVSSCIQRFAIQAYHHLHNSLIGILLNSALRLSLLTMPPFVGPQRLLILGATGPTGLIGTKVALERGHSVIIYARTPSKLPEEIMKNPKVTVSPLNIHSQTYTHLPKHR